MEGARPRRACTAGSGARKGKIAFLFPGQGSQYLNMGRELAEREPSVAQVFSEADAVMQRIVGHPLTDFIFVDEPTPQSLPEADDAMQQTAICQPAVLTLDEAMHRLFADFGIRPDLVMGHSLGEYGALVAAGVMPFAHALEAAAARGREMTRVSLGDNGWMAAVMAPLAVVEETLAVGGRLRRRRQHQQQLAGGDRRRDGRRAEGHRGLRAARDSRRSACR